MRLRYILSLFAAFLLVLGVHLATASAATSSTPVIPPPATLTGLVRIELRNSQGNVLAFGSGAIIDPDGRVLTTNDVISKWQKNKGVTLWICTTKKETDAPLCNMTAVILKNDAGKNLALLEVRRVQIGDTWLMLEEYATKTKFHFTPVTFPLTATTTDEGIHLGDSLKAMYYAKTGASTISFTDLAVSGFDRAIAKNISVPNLVRTSVTFRAGTGGGGVFDASSTMIGIPVFTKEATSTEGDFISTPVINQFLNVSLGKEYVNRKTPFALTGSLLGVSGGVVTSTFCPDYSSPEGTGNRCRCHQGFYAVGHACVLGNNYCALHYPGSRYDIFMKSCQCDNKDGSRVCREAVSTPTPTATKPSTPAKQATPVSPSTPVVAVTRTKPATSTSSTSNSSPAHPLCPAHASYNAQTWMCTCDKTFAKNVTGTACVLNGIPTSTSTIMGCDFVGNTITHLYYKQGHAKIKTFTPKNAVCFATPTLAMRARYRRGR